MLHLLDSDSVAHKQQRDVCPPDGAVLFSIIN